MKVSAARRAVVCLILVFITIYGCSKTVAPEPSDLNEGTLKQLGIDFRLEPFPAGKQQVNVGNGIRSMDGIAVDSSHRTGLYYSYESWDKEFGRLWIVQTYSPAHGPTVALYDLRKKTDGTLTAKKVERGIND